MTTLRRRRLWFLLGVALFCGSLFLFIPWQAVLALLVILAIFLAGPLETLWKLVRDQPVHTPAYKPKPSYPGEEHAYTQGYQELPPPSQGTYYYPPERDEPLEVPEAQYPSQQIQHY